MHGIALFELLSLTSAWMSDSLACYAGQGLRPLHSGWDCRYAQEGYREGQAPASVLQVTCGECQSLFKAFIYTA